MSKRLALIFDILGLLFLGMALQCGAESILLYFHAMNAVTPANSLVVGTFHSILAFIFLFIRICFRR